jgi:hypothetical protein
LKRFILIPNLFLLCVYNTGGRSIRPTHTWVNLIAGYLNRKKVPADYIFPVDTLFVGTDGSSSHTYAYVSAIEFVPNSNVVALLPKRDMNLREKIYYALCISRNRYRFSYGRKPKGGRLASINLPEHPPEWLDERVEELLKERLQTIVLGIGK